MMVQRAVQCLTLTGLLLLFAACPTTPPTPAPTANAGPDQVVVIGATVTLDGSASAGNAPLTYQWQFTERPTGSSSNLSGAGDSRPTFTPDQLGDYVLSLTVFNSAGSSSPDTVTISVTGALATVPILVGLTAVEAEAALIAAGLTLGTTTSQSSTTVPSGQIISQIPAANASVLPESTVDIVVSTGAGTATVPDITGQSRSEAEMALMDARLTLGTVSASPSESFPEGEVITQSIAADTAVEEGTTIDLVLSSGPPVNLQHVGSFDLRKALNDPGEGNVLRPSAAAVDPENGRIYVTSQLSHYAAVYDTTTLQVTSTLDIEFRNTGIKRPFIAPNGTQLYVFSEATNVLGRIPVGTGDSEFEPLGEAIQDLAIESNVDRLYVTSATSPSLRVLNAMTMKEVETTTALDGKTGQMLFDPTTNRLYVLDTMTVGDEGTLTVYNTGTRVVDNVINFRMPGSGTSTALRFDIDTAGQRFFVLGSNGLDVFMLEGTETRQSIRALVPRSGYTLTDMRFYAGDIAANDRILALGLARPSSGTVAPRGARLFAFNPNPAQVTSPTDVVDLGEGNVEFVVDPMTQTFLSPDGITGTLWTLDPAPFPLNLTPLHLGINIDQIAVINGALYGNSPFGGNFLFRLDLETDAVVTVQGGTWPAPFRIRNADGPAPSLVVLNAWDSTLDHLSIGANTAITATTNTGFPAGSTERVPDMALDPTGARVAVAYPEFGQVRVRSLDSNNTLAVIDVPDALLGDAVGGKGQLQVYFNQEDGAVLYVFDRNQLLLHRYDTADGYAHLGSTDLSKNVDDVESIPGSDWLYHDVARKRLYIGPVPVDPVSGELNGESLPIGRIIRAADDLRNFYWTIRRLQTVNVLVRVDRDTNMALDELPYILDGTHLIDGEFAFDTVNRQFFVANSLTTVIEKYSY